MFAALQRAPTAPAHRPQPAPPTNRRNEGHLPSGSESSMSRSLAGSVSLSLNNGGVRPGTSFSFGSMAGNSASFGGGGRGGRGMMRDEFSSLDRHRDRSRSPVRRAHAQPISQMPPPPAQTPAHMRSNIDRCGVCREQLSSMFDDNRAQDEAVDTGGAKSTKKQAKARSAMQSSISDLYRVIFQVEEVLRGLIDDATLLPLLLKLHRDLIETQASDNYVDVVPWTIEMLRDHFHPVHGHTFDKIRETQHSLKLIKQTMCAVANSVTRPDPNNPAVQTVDHRAAAAHTSIASTHARLVRELANLHARKDERLADAVFRLISAIEKREPEVERISRDPRAAAGTVAAGGDTRDSVAVNQNDATVAGSAAAFFQTSGF